MLIGFLFTTFTCNARWLGIRACEKTQKTKVGVLKNVILLGKITPDR
jgi:hypothetical protein